MSNIKIGWAMRDVSTLAPVNIPGQFHMRVSEGVSDPVTVSALVLDDGRDQVIFVSADLVVIRDHLLDDVRAKVVALNPDIPAMKILMSATHAHTGPSHYDEERYTRPNPLAPEGVPLNGVEVASGTQYRDFLSTQIARAVCEAYDTRAEGGISYGYGYAVVAHSRRVVYYDDYSQRPGSVINSTHGVDGHARMYGETSDNMFSHYEAGADHFINIMFTHDAQGKLTGAVINIPCPSQCSEHDYKLSADYWHDVREAIRARHGDINILAQCAAAGDLSPRVLHYKQAQSRRFRLKYGDMLKDRAERRDIAERVACAFDEVLAWARNDIKTDVEIKHIVRTVDLSARIISDEEYLSARAGLEAAMRSEFETSGDPKRCLFTNSIIIAGRSRYSQIIKRYEQQKTCKTVPMELHAIRLGDIAFASNRFELYMDYQHRIQARSPFEQTFIVQLAAQPGTEGGSYLCTERGEWGKGYSASVFCNVVSPQGGRELVEETLNSLNELR